MSAVSHSPIDFSDLSLVEIPVNFPNKTYLLREASGDVAVAYRNAALARTKLGPEGKASSVEGMADLEPLLVHWCLFDGDQRVPEATIRAWPARIQKELFSKAKEISKLSDDDTLESLEKQRTEIDAKIANIKATQGKN